MLDGTSSQTTTTLLECSSANGEHQVSSNQVKLQKSQRRREVNFSSTKSLGEEKKETNGDITSSSKQVIGEKYLRVGEDDNSTEVSVTSRSKQASISRISKSSGADVSEEATRHLTAEPETRKATSGDVLALKEARGQQQQQQVDELKANKVKDTDKEFEAELVWRNIILFIILHSCFPIGVYMLITQRPWKTLVFSILGMYASGLGVTGGSHRLWSHRSYKAKWPVQVILVILQTMAGQNSIYTWSRDHRVHHKFSETNADPHNIKRGFFFAHMGWLCCKKHPDVKEKGKVIDMSDLEANPYVMFQHRHFWWMSALFTVLVPTMIPVLLWNERFWTSFVFSFMIRYLITLHGTWLVNSAAHYYGHRPYDTKIEARESPYVIYNALGEGFHNYHHTFPFDYATSEFGRYLNITTTFIDLCASLGLVYERRKVDPDSVLKRRLRTGNLSGNVDSTVTQLSGKSSLSAAADSTTQSMVRRLLRSKSNKSLTIDEADEPLNSATGDHDQNQNLRFPLNNIIHELPYISGLTSMKYTM